MIDPADVKSRDDFIGFVRALRDDFESGGDEWSSLTIPDFLEVISAWAEDSEFAASSEAWRTAAIVLWIGRIYE